MKLMTAPTAPKPSGEMPNSQFSGESASMFVPGMKNQPLQVNRYTLVETSPASMPTTAPAEFIFVEKMPIMIAGKSELAASPKAKATVWAANPGGFMPIDRKGVG